jgi:glycosyltransferase involved in cell wall biosynthesis
LLYSRGALDGWSVMPLEGLHHADVAERLRACRIFLNFSYQEGFGLPAAEAMACGNYVIGYHGYGGKEFFRSPSSCRIETGDVLGVARAVEEAVHRDRMQPSWCIERGLAASRFILETYSKEREREDVVKAYAELTSVVESRPRVALGSNAMA